MFDIPEIIQVLKESGASEEVVEKVSSHFHNRLGDTFEGMAIHFGANIKEAVDTTCHSGLDRRLVDVLYEYRLNGLNSGIFHGINICECQ